MAHQFSEIMFTDSIQKLGSRMSIGWSLEGPGNERAMYVQIPLSHSLMTASTPTP